MSDTPDDKPLSDAEVEAIHRAWREFVGEDAMGFWDTVKCPECELGRWCIQIPRCFGVCRGCGNPDATLAPCPYALELHGDESPVWLCDACRQEAAADV